MEAQLELCFLTKVKDYCDAKVLQSDAASISSAVSDSTANDLIPDQCNSVVVIS